MDRARSYSRAWYTASGYRMRLPCSSESSLSKTRQSWSSCPAFRSIKNDSRVSGTRGPGRKSTLRMIIGRPWKSTRGPFTKRKISYGRLEVPRGELQQNYRMRRKRGGRKESIRLTICSKKALQCSFTTSLCLKAFRIDLTYDFFRFVSGPLPRQPPALFALSKAFVDVHMFIRTFQLGAIVNAISKPHTRAYRKRAF
jgi:hypothetical protein